MLFIREHLPAAAFPPFALDTAAPPHRPGADARRKAAPPVLPSLCSLPHLGTGRPGHRTPRPAALPNPAFLGTVSLLELPGGPRFSRPLSSRGSAGLTLAASNALAHAHLSSEGTRSPLARQQACQEGAWRWVPWSPGWGCRGGSSTKVRTKLSEDVCGHAKLCPRGPPRKGPCEEAQLLTPGPPAPALFSHSSQPRNPRNLL